MKTKLKIYFGKNLEYYQVRQKCYFGMGFGFRFSSVDGFLLSSVNGLDQIITCLMQTLTTINIII